MVWHGGPDIAAGTLAEHAVLADHGGRECAVGSKAREAKKSIHWEAGPTCASPGGYHRCLYRRSAII